MAGKNKLKRSRFERTRRFFRGSWRVETSIRATKKMTETFYVIGAFYRGGREVLIHRTDKDGKIIETNLYTLLEHDVGAIKQPQPFRTSEP